MFQINLSQEAKRDLRKINKKDRGIILKKIYSIRKNPLHFIERLSGVNLWKLRIGEYRAILQIVTKTDTINVINLEIFKYVAKYFYWKGVKIGNTVETRKLTLMR